MLLTILTDGKQVSSLGPTPIYWCALLEDCEAMPGLSEMVRFLKCCIFNTSNLPAITFFFFLSFSHLSQNAKSISNFSNLKPYDQSSHTVRTVLNCSIHFLILYLLPISKISMRQSGILIHVNQPRRNRKVQKSKYHILLGIMCSCVQFTPMFLAQTFRKKNLSF